MITFGGNEPNGMFDDMWGYAFRFKNVETQNQADHEQSELAIALQQEFKEVRIFRDQVEHARASAQLWPSEGATALLKLVQDELASWGWLLGAEKPMTDTYGTQVTRH